MKLFKLFFILIGVWILCAETALGQKPGFVPPPRRKSSDLYRNPVRVMLNQFSITGTTGYGLAMYSHELNNVYFYQSQSNQIIVPIVDGEPAPTGVIAGNSNWFNRSTYGDTLDLTNYFEVPYRPLDEPVFNPELRREFSMATDTMPLKFRSLSHSIPIGVVVHFNYQNFRAGAGATFERQYFTSFKPTTFKETIRPFEPEVSPVFFQRYFVTVGYKFYDFWSYSFAGEAQIGVLRGGGKIKGEQPIYDYDVIQRGAFFNLGISIEKNLSEYFRVLVKPSFDYHNFSTTIGDPSAPSIAIPHKQQTFFIQAGVSINIPDIRRCPLPSCAIQLKHAHNGNNEIVRGQPITKHQNPKMGQNHRKLFRYKWKNRNKIEPY
ncbi:MAG: hypothetical protein RIG68_09545 [Imperialibacter sp.]|uniref:hypothetical protein n=1 Tax=Imperialibacter sp. TaxID=2038411 RepID=UPI0032EE50E1